MENPINVERLRDLIESSTNATALAKKIGHDRVQVSSWKNGRRIPTLLSALYLARGLGVSVEELCYDILLPAEVDALEAAEEPMAAPVVEEIPETEDEAASWVADQQVEDQAA